jgi:hypothetical protein
MRQAFTASCLPSRSDDTIPTESLCTLVKHAAACNWQLHACRRHALTSLPKCRHSMHTGDSPLFRAPADGASPRTFGAESMRLLSLAGRGELACSPAQSTSTGSQSFQSFSSVVSASTLTNHLCLLHFQLRIFKCTRESAQRFPVSSDGLRA